jgi:hypothetical protein
MHAIAMGQYSARGEPNRYSLGRRCSLLHVGVP